MFLRDGNAQPNRCKEDRRDCPREKHVDVIDKNSPTIYRRDHGGMREKSAPRVQEGWLRPPRRHKHAVKRPCLDSNNIPVERHGKRN